jgi:hypothetical protein
MTLRTGIVVNGEVVMDPKRVARKYFHSWFIVDLISNFPLVLFLQSSGKSLKIVKLQKIPKLLRIGRLLKYLREYAKYYNLLVSFLGLAMGLHLFACLWASLFNECDGVNGAVLCTENEVCTPQACASSCCRRSHSLCETASANVRPVRPHHHAHVPWDWRKHVVRQHRKAHQPCDRGQHRALLHEHYRFPAGDDLLLLPVRQRSHVAHELGPAEGAVPQSDGHDQG